MVAHLGRVPNSIVPLCWSAIMSRFSDNLGAWIGCHRPVAYVLLPFMLSGWNRNVHNRVTSEGVQYGSYMKTVAKLILVCVFLLAPFLLRHSKNELFRFFTPSR